MNNQWMPHLLAKLKKLVPAKILLLIRSTSNSIDADNFLVGLGDSVYLSSVKRRNHRSSA